MAFQQTKHVKMSSNNSSFPLQIHMAGTPVNLSNARELLKISNIPNPSVAVPLQMPIPCSSLPLLSSALNTNATNQHPQATISVLPSTSSNAHLTGSGINLPIHMKSSSSHPGIHGNIIQLHMANSQTSRMSHLQSSIAEKNKEIMQSASHPSMQLQMQDHSNGPPIQLKIQGPIGGSSSVQVAATPLQMQSGHSSNGAATSLHSQVPSSSSNVQVRGNNNRSLPPVVYIQTAVGLKQVSGSDITTNTSVNPQQIIVRRPVTTGTGGIQFLSAMNSKSTICGKPTTVSKQSILAPAVSSQSIVIQKSKAIAQPKVSVSLASTPAKHTISAYVGGVKKPVSITKPTESQSVLMPTSHLSVSTASNQKLFLTPMNMHKLPNKYVFPMVSKGPVINLQIANGQLQNDTQGSITVMRDSNIPPAVSDVPPLQPFSKNFTSSGSSTSLSSSCLTQSNSMLDNGFTTSIPGSRAELIGEQEYTLSIPETNASMNDDVYTVSISDENDDNSPEQYTISIPEKGQSLLCKNSLSGEEVSHDIRDFDDPNPIPSILRRSNSDNIEKKFGANIRRRISLCNDSTEDRIGKMEMSKSKLLNKTVSLLSKNIQSESSGDPNITSLFCDEKLEIDLEGREITPVKQQPDVILEEVKQNNGTADVPRHVPIIKDRRKSRISGDLLYQGSFEKINEVNNAFISHEKEASQFVKQATVKTVSEPGLEEDSLGLQWQNKVGVLKGSSLQFHTNEFGLIDILDTDDCAVSCASKYHTPLKHRAERNERKTKPMSPEDLYCCDGCGCHGMAAEFVTPNFCSHNCQKNYSKSQLKKDRDSYELKKRRKKKKPLIVKPKVKETEEIHIEAVEIPKVENIQLEVIESLPSKAIIEEPPKILEELEHDHKYPWMSSKSGFSWMKYLNHCKAKAAPAKLFKEQVSYKNLFRMGMKLEAIDPVHPALYAAVTITEIQGFRIKLHFDSHHEDYDFWVNSDSCDIFPPGWCEKNGRVLRPPMGFTQGTFNWPLYLKQAKAIAAPKPLFAHVTQSVNCPNGFRIGMKLEAEDRKNSLTCVATVADIMGSRVLIHFDSWDDIYDYWVDPTSPYIHPVGWCDQNGYSLTPPNFFKDPEHFTWEQYLSGTNSSTVPARAFKPRPPHNFKTGMKLEVVDKRVPFLIRVATVSDTRFHQIRVSFDGWPDELSYWVDDDSPDIHPLDWCLKTGHGLEPPLSEDDAKIKGECGTSGCYGLGNLLGAKRTTHSTAIECPYKLPVVSPTLRDRLAGVRPPPSHSEPRAKEPRKLTAPQRGRPPKSDSNNTSRNTNNTDEIKEKYQATRGRPPKCKKKLDEIKTEVLGSEDDSNSNQSKRKRNISPISQEKMERSVYEPGYLPNPTWSAPPAWSTHRFPIEEILEQHPLRVDPRNWSQSDVKDFVERVSKSRDLSWLFSKHHIDGESFLMLTQEDLIGVLGMRLGPAIKVYNSIVQLRQRILT